MHSNRLTCSSNDRMLGGVCGGLAKYVGINSTLVRLFFVLFTVWSGFGALMYILLWVILPNEDHLEEDDLNSGNLSTKVQNMGEDVRQAVRQPNPKALIYMGAALILGGIYYLLRALNLPWMSRINDTVLLPTLLIVVGGVLLYRAIRGGRQ